MNKRLEITFGKDGSVKSEVKGVKGPQCLEMTAFLNKVFGDDGDVQLKTSYHETVEETETDHVVDGLPSGHCG